MRNKKELYLDLLIWFRLSRVYNNSIKASNKHLKNWNLTAAQFDVLVQIGTSQRLSQQELADKLFVTKGNITQLLGKLEDMGLIEKEQEWRTKYIKLSDKGLQLFETCAPLQEEFQASHFSSLDTEEKKQLIRLLKKIHIHDIE